MVRAHERDRCPRERGPRASMMPTCPTYVGPRVAELRPSRPRVLYGYRAEDWCVPRYPTPPQKPNSRFTLRPYDYRPVASVVARQIGPVCNSANYLSPDPHDPLNVIGGLINRVLIQPPTHCFLNYQLRHSFKAFVTNWIKVNLAVVGQPLSFEDWLIGLNVPQIRKEQLRTAYEMGELPDSWNKCKSFIKREFYEMFKPPRTINSRVDNYKACSGRWFQFVEKSLIFQVSSFVKGLTPNERALRAAELTCQYRYKYVSDFSRFESQMTREVMQSCELILYRFFGVPERFLRPLVGINKLKFNNVSASVVATRMSGDMCTSLGNGFTNLMVNSFVASLHNSRISGVVEGDDGLFCTDVMPTEADFSQWGFRMSVKTVNEVGMAGFCSSFWTNSGVCVVNPVRHLMRLGWSFHCTARASVAVREELLKSKCRSLIDLAPGCPLLWRTAAWFSESGYERNPYDVWKHGTEAGQRIFKSSLDLIVPSSDQRQIVSDLFGITTRDQLRYESMIDRYDFSFLSELAIVDQFDGATYQGYENEFSNEKSSSFY